MIDKTAANRLIGSSLQAKFYQQFLASIGNMETLGTRLVQHLERANSFRQLDEARLAIDMLCNHPSERFRVIGQYYNALSLAHFGSGNLNTASQLLEKVASHATIRGRALVSLGTVLGDKGDIESELYYYQEALKAAQDLTTKIKAYRGIALVKSLEGYHAHALTDLESLYPLVKHAPPHIYFDYMNSMAVELSEVGRLQEAKNISTLVCNSPLAPYYKEWRETHAEVNHKLYKSRSTVHVVLPKREPKKRTKKAKILPFPQRKPDSFMRPSYGPPTRAEISEAIDRGKGLDPKQIHALILKVVLQDRVTDDEIMHIVEVYYDAMVYGLE